jgi:hypothetical protein
MKRLITIILLFLPITIFAPDNNVATLIVGTSINPYENLFSAACTVESDNNPLAINLMEEAYGIVQIRQGKLTDFNNQTSKHYSLEDCLNPEIAREIYMHFASKYGPTDIETIAKTWNGSGPMTETYWNKIKDKL